MGLRSEGEWRDRGQRSIKCLESEIADLKRERDRLAGELEASRKNALQLQAANDQALDVAFRLSEVLARTEEENRQLKAGAEFAQKCVDYWQQLAEERLTLIRVDANAEHIKEMLFNQRLKQLSDDISDLIKEATGDVPPGSDPA